MGWSLDGLLDERRFLTQKKKIRIAAMTRKMMPPTTPPAMGPTSECFGLEVGDGLAVGVEVEVELVSFAS